MAEIWPWPILKYWSCIYLWGLSENNEVPVKRAAQDNPPPAQSKMAGHYTANLVSANKSKYFY